MSSRARIQLQGRPFVVLVTGSRNLHSYGLVAIHLNQHLCQCLMLGMCLVVRHGACRGADLLAHQWCQRHSELVAELEYPAERYGKWPACGPKRNAAMVADGANECVAFWDGRIEKSGTLDCMAKATRAGIPVEIVPVGRTRKWT